MARVIVIGGGIGGLAAAIALGQAGLDVNVYERATVRADTGAGLSLWANAIAALERLGLGGFIRANSFEYAVGGLRSWRGDVLTTISSTELRKAFPVPVIVVHRAELLAALTQAAGAERLHLERRCVAVSETDDRVCAEFADGERVDADMLVGADGLNSVVREAIHGRQPPRYAGCTAWRSVVRFAGPIEATESWGYGSVFGQVPMSGGRVYWYATQNMPEGQPRGADEKRYLLERFGRWHAPIGALIDAAEESAILRNDIYDRDPLPAWGRGRITLLGDAAHPMTPFLGQGGCQALEDAVALGRSLGSEPDVAAALRRYEGQRIRRANMFVRRSRMVGRIAQLEAPLLVRLRNAAVSLANPRAQARQIARMIDGS